jgi:uncharacterized membrane protein YgcG
MFGWLFGKKKECCGNTTVCASDPRATLKGDEEWATPEQWFTDTDGKRVRRKKKVGECCGGICHEETDVVVVDEGIDPLPVILAVDYLTRPSEPTPEPLPTPVYEPPAYTPPAAPAYDPPAYSPPPTPSYDPPSYSPPASSCSSSSGSSCSSSSGSSCSSGGSSCSSGGGSSCGGGGGGD